MFFISLKSFSVKLRNNNIKLNFELSHAYKFLFPTPVTKCHNEVLDGQSQIEMGECWDF